ncbi:hypothetical protein Droror1_Dr00015128 [Drosera rotundifolia]
MDAASSSLSSILVSPYCCWFTCYIRWQAQSSCVLDCTGSGDIDTSTVVKADGDGRIRGASGALLAVNPSWKNPSEEWHVGSKLVYEFFTNSLISRLKKERKKK